MSDTTHLNNNKQDTEKQQHQPEHRARDWRLPQASNQGEDQEC